MSTAKKSMMNSAPTAAGSLSPIPEDQCFDWLIGISDGVLKKEHPVTFPVNMQKIKEKERKRREAAEKAALAAGKKRGDYVVTISKQGPQFAAPAQASKLTVCIVASVFIALFFGSLIAFIYFLVTD